MSTGLSVVPFSNTMEKEWDFLVQTSSVNGTFLQTRNFLNYHPDNRFIDASLVVKKGEKIIAVLPACEIRSEEGIELFSHKGSTYGGIIIDRKHYYAENVIEIVALLDDYLKNRYSKVTMKITSDIHSRESSDLLQFALEYNGYSNFAELNTYIDIANLGDDVTDNFDRNKKRNIKKCIEHGLVFRPLENDDEIMGFYNLLRINLSKYELKPIHTIEEILDFAHSRIPNNTRFYGVFNDSVMMAGGMMFVFDNVNVIHAQNLSADYRFDEYSPITYMYYGVINQARIDGYKALTWGISTEDNGKKLNYGLIRNKESYGSKYQLNRTFYKVFK